MMKMMTLLTTLLGLALRYMVKRRKFNRRNEKGIEIFTSYESAWLIRLLEGFLFWGGTLLLIFSVGWMLLHH